MNLHCGRLNPFDSVGQNLNKGMDECGASDSGRWCRARGQRSWVSLELIAIRFIVVYNFFFTCWMYLDFLSKQFRVERGSKCLIKTDSFVRLGASSHTF